MTRFQQIRNKAAVLRNIKLSTVLQQTGAVIDKKDPTKWHTSQGILSIKGQKFFNWTQAVGGGGAIDLIIHLQQVDFIHAVGWLADNFSCPDRQTLSEVKPLVRVRKPLVLPKINQKALPRITHYLTSKRCLPKALIQSLINSGKLYADDRANAVFLLLGKGKGVVGAKIRGTSTRSWHALAPGSRKDLGCFFVKINQSRKVVICESAIDAISYYSLDPDCITLSTAGAHPNPAWLSNLVRSRFKVLCGFDADNTGDELAEKMMSLYPGIERLRPPKHDWNDVIKI